jgi:hypothetical protein
MARRCFRETGSDRHRVAMDGVNAGAGSRTASADRIVVPPADMRVGAGVFSETGAIRRSSKYEDMICAAAPRDPLYAPARAD